MFSRINIETLDLGAVFAASPNAYVIFDEKLVIAGCNRAYLEAVGRSSSAEIVGRYLFEAFPTDETTASYKLLRRSLDRVLETGERDHIAVIPYDTSQAGEPPNMRYWSATHTPIADLDGKLRFILQHTVDVTELQHLRERGTRDFVNEAGVLARAKAVEAEKEALDTERHLLREMFVQAPGFIGILAGPAHTFMLANNAYRTLTGGRELEGLTVADALPEVVEQGFIELLDRVYRTAEPYVGRSVEVLLQQPGEAKPQLRYVDFVYQPIVGADGKVGGIFVQGNDVTEKVLHDKAQTLHRRELAHRLKNQLAVIQAVVNQSLRSAADLESVRPTIAARLQSLASAHDSLVSGNVGSTTVAEIVSRTLGILEGSGSGQFRVSGPDVELGPGAALSLSLILHELMTNALKHGSLSTPEGKVLLSWNTGEDGRHFMLRWEEAGGPPVTRVGRTGAGSRLIRAGLSGVADSRVTLEFPETGVVCVLTGSLDAISAEAPWFE